MTRRHVAVVLAGVLATGLAAGATRESVAASWTDAERAGGGVGAALADCTTPGIYTATASGRFLSGTVAGRSLDGVAALPGVRTTATGSTVEAVPATSLPSGDGAYRSGLEATALQGLTVRSTGVSVPVRFSSVGVYSQVAGASGAGRATGAAGAVTDSGAIDTGGIASGTEPSTGTVDVDRALAAAGGAAPSGLSSITLSVGAVASTTAVDGCALVWGRSASSAVRRDYRVASLALVATSGAAARFGRAVSTASGAFDTAVAGIADGLARGTAAEAAVGDATASGVRTAVRNALGALAGTVSVDAGTASSSPLDADRTAEATALAARTASGGAATAPSSGGIVLDLAALGGGIERQAPNTPVLSATAATNAAASLEAARTAYRSGLGTAWSSLAAGVVTDSAATATVTVAGVPVYSVAVTAHQAGTGAPVVASVRVTQLPQTLPSGAPSVTSVTSAVSDRLQTDLVAPLTTTIRSRIATPLADAAGTAGSAARGAQATEQAAAAAELAALPDAIGLTVNVQPDAAPGPAAPDGLPAGALSDTALRIAIPAGRSDGVLLDLATSSAGPIRPLAAR